MSVYDYDFWRPMTPWQAKSLFEGFDRPWWIAGGWAIDLYLGGQTREHHDLDVGVFARDQRAVHEHLSRCGWELHCAAPPGRLRHWTAGEELPPAVHDIWCRRGGAESPWELQLMLNPGHRGHWVSRRDPAVRFGWAKAIRRAEDGIPYLASHLQLHFKAKGVRDRDEVDLAAVAEALPPESRAWLHANIERTYGAGHPWLARL